MPLTTVTRIDPPIPLMVRRDCVWQKAMAHFLIDYGFEHDLMFVTFVDDTHECWTIRAPDVRSQDNISSGRLPMAEFRFHPKPPPQLDPTLETLVRKIDHMSATVSTLDADIAALQAAVAAEAAVEASAVVLLNGIPAMITDAVAAALAAGATPAQLQALTDLATAVSANSAPLAAAVAANTPTPAPAPAAPTP